MSCARDNLISDEMSEKIIETAEKMATSDGAHTITVRKILTELNITNRVFYNRFHNIEEVLGIIYNNTILKIRESITVELDEDKDFFEQVIEILERTLLISYDTKKKFNHYVFEQDSKSRVNYEWWINEIKKLIEYAKEKNYIKDVDSNMLSYSIWCFCRGYNADALERNFSKEYAVKIFRRGFELLFEGIKNK